LTQESLDSGFISGTKTLSGLENLLECNLRDDGVEIGLLDGDSLVVGFQSVGIAVDYGQG
jgi:hypothetical protein